MYITSLDKVKKTVPDMPGIKALAKQVPISRENGAPNFSFRVFTIEPGGHTPLHSHPFEHLNYVIEGNGVLFAENRENPIKKGDFLMVLPGETHQYRNNSTAPVLFICAVPNSYE
jgi:quercetin dioxygenase-like cupin family protein